MGFALIYMYNVYFQCVPLSGRGFRFGSYQCVCRHGYKHPFSSMAWFDGETMEQEYEKKQNGQSNRYV